MPTLTEIRELINSCKWTWTTLGGVNGYKVESKVAGNNNWIFLPATGFKRGGDVPQFGESRGYYWSSTMWETQANDMAYILMFTSNSQSWSNQPRYCGLAIRPVNK